MPGVYIEREKSVAGVKAILSGKYDDLSDDPFYMIGEVEDAEKKPRKVNSFQLPVIS